jgi:hypothetical protein
MTYEQSVHNFALRWLLEHPDKFDLTRLDPSRYIEVEEQTDSNGCYSCDFEVEVTHAFRVPVVDSDQLFYVYPGLSTADIMRGCLAEGNLDPPTVDPLALASARILLLEAKLASAEEKAAAYKKDFETLKAGVACQEGLWQILKDTHRELDLWFNAPNKDAHKVDFTVEVKGGRTTSTGLWAP